MCVAPLGLNQNKSAGGGVIMNGVNSIILGAIDERFASDRDFDLTHYAN